MSTPPRALAALHSDTTRTLILASAVRVLEEGSMAELSVRGVARRAGISERTVFRYFRGRDEFLDAVADAVITALELPPDPGTVEELLALPRALFSTFESKAALATAALHSDLFPRIRDRSGASRWQAVRKVVDRWAPRRPLREREIAAVNIRFFLSAMTWHYYRSYFHLDLERTVECAATAIRQTLYALAHGRR